MPEIFEEIAKRKGNAVSRPLNRAEVPQNLHECLGDDRRPWQEA